MRHSAVPPAPVPKAPIHEHRHALSPEDKIRLSRQRLVPPPAHDSIRPKNLNQPQFSFFIADRAHCGHHGRALLA